MRRERETQDVELDWTDEEPAETRRRLAEAQGRRLSGGAGSSKQSKDKGKGRALQPRGSFDLDLALEPLPDLDPLAPLASDASAVCDLPSPLFPNTTIRSSDGALLGGFVNLSTPERKRALAHLEAQVVYNDRVEAHHEACAAASEEEEARKEAVRRKEQEMRARLAATVEEEAKRNAAARALAASEGPAASKLGREGAVPTVGREGEAQVAEVETRSTRKWRCGKCELEVRRPFLLHAHLPLALSKH